MAKRGRGGEQRPPSLLRELLAAQKPWLAALMVTIALTAVIWLTLANVVVQMVDRGLVEQSVPLSRFVRQALLVAAIAVPVSLAQRQVSDRIGYQIEWSLRLRLYRALQSADLGRLDRLASGQLVTRAMTDLTMIEKIIRLLPIVVTVLPFIAGTGIYLSILNPVIGVLSIISFPLNLLILLRFRDRLRLLSWSELNERAEVTTAIDEPVRGIRVVKAFGREDHERQSVAGASLRAYRYAMSRWRLLARFDIPMKFFPVVTHAAVLLVGAHLAANGRLTLGTFLLAFQVVSSLTGLANIVDELASAWQYLRSAEGRVREVLDLEEEPVTGDPLPPPGPGIELISGTKSYGARSVLSGIDLSAAPGELVVVAGAPGSGKSTLAGALGGTVGLDDGVVLVDGAEIDGLDPELVRQAVRVVPEDSYLFAVSLRSNLELAVPGGEATDEQMDTALWAAAVDDYVVSLPAGLDHNVGDRGLTLSGGQRQRVALARALVSPPRVLVLDDALSAVNPSLELEILGRIKTAYPRTAVICTNRRRGAAAIADRVVELPDPDPTYVEELQPTLPADTSIASSGLDTATIERVLGDFQLTDELPVVTENAATADSPATIRLLLRSFKAPAAVAFVALVVLTLSQLAPEVLFGNIADSVEDGDTGAATIRAGWLLVIGLVGALAAWFFRIYSQMCSQGAMYLLRRRVFQRLSRLGIDHYDRELPGQVAARIVNDLDILWRYVQSTAFTSAIQIMRMVLGLVVIIVIAPGVAPVALGVFAVIAVVALAQYRATTRAFEGARAQLGDVVSSFEEDFGARHEIRSFGATANQTRAFEAKAWELRRLRFRSTLLANSFSSVLEALGHVAAVLVLYQAGDLVLAGSITVGSALALRLLATQISTPLATIGRLYGETIEVRASWRRLQEPYAVPVFPPPTSTARPVPEPLRGDVEVDSVVFAYPGTGRPILHGVSLQLPARSVTALVGYTGAGKSTIAKLVSRIYDPELGSVRIDGVDLREMDPQGYRSRVGVVPQEPFLFRGTVGSNIAYGRPGASPAEIRTAAAAVGADRVLEALPGGYEHPVTEDGRNLTAAQRQLVSLARAWLATPDILILDEATSCLDVALEGRVLASLRELDCTALMVTHRENVVAACERVVVLDEGLVVEQGSPAELVGTGGAYDRLWVAVEDTATLEGEPT